VRKFIQLGQIPITVKSIRNVADGPSEPSVFGMSSLPVLQEATVHGHGDGLAHCFRDATRLCHYYF
jgi:hypothetical protein